MLVCLFTPIIQLPYIVCTTLCACIVQQRGIKERYSSPKNDEKERRYFEKSIQWKSILSNQTHLNVSVQMLVVPGRQNKTEREKLSCPCVTQSYAINMLPCSFGAQAFFNGAWWLEHGRHLAGTLYCYAFIYMLGSCVSFSVFCGLTKTLVSMKLCQEGWENKVWGLGVWEFVGVRKSAVVSSYYMKSLDVERLGLRRKNMKAAVTYSFVRP